MNKNLVVFGSFGFGNVGDEAVPYAVEDILASIGIERKISIVSRFNNPKLKNVIGLSNSYLSALEELADAPMIICGGGIIEPREMCCALRFEQYLKITKPSQTAIFAGSFEFGVDYGLNIKRKLRSTFSKIDKIYTRDYVSEIYLSENFPKVDTSTIGDIVLGMKASKLRPAAVEFEDDEYITVSLSAAWKSSPDWYDWISAELKTLSNDLDKPLLFVPMSCDKSDDDRVEHKIVLDKINLLGVNNEPVAIVEPLLPPDIAAVYRDSLLIISMRLHGCVMSYGQMTPFVGLSYHPKLSGFAKTVGWQHFILPNKDLPVKQDKGKYGYAFSSLNLDSGDLCRVANEALKFGSFNLLPLFRDSLKRSLKDFLSC
jgi:polysaccharide pyruvyl transferase WcaK-like protein